MYYDIESFCPIPKCGMGAHSFSITLYAGWKELVEMACLDQDRVDRLIELRGREWLDACGFDRIFDPDNCGFDADKTLPPGPRAYPTYRPPTDLRIKWGEWGPEHIMVPGDACGLNIDKHCPGLCDDSACLLPHNIDTWNQKNLLMIAFTKVACMLATFGRAG
jgi:hypothetical protein